MWEAIRRDVEALEKRWLAEELSDYQFAIQVAKLVEAWAIKQG